MQTRSELWLSMWADGAPVETVVVVGGTTYTAIANPVIDRAAMQSALSIGNCVSATLQITVNVN